MNVNQTLEGETANLALLESLYQQYQTNPAQLSLSWQRYFEALDRQGVEAKIGLKPALSVKDGISASKEDVSAAAVDSRIFQLIEAYRRNGHLMAHVNPLVSQPPEEPESLRLDRLGFEERDLKRFFPTFGLLPQGQAPLSSLLDALRNLYCRHIGFEYKYGSNPDLENWLQNYIEKEFFKTGLSPEQKRLTLEYLNRSELLETFLHTKYVGQKRFSLEGTETLIPMLALMLESASEEGVEEAVLGMAHRGRLNVLTNILNKSFQLVFNEFEDNYIPESFEGMGDVKYHKGFKGHYARLNAKKIRLTVSPNPSHLESVDSVVEGMTRAKQFLEKDEEDRKKVIPILIHGDAALSGQGVVYETLQLAKLPGYATGGTIHLVINNQIGFTTIPRDLRSTVYCTDIAKAFGLPVFHVNAEDPDSCVQVALLALLVRQRFHCDVFIDLNGYRKYGHNESDEPAFTQPIEYRVIRNKRPIREIYRNRLIEQGIVQKGEMDEWEERFKLGLQEAHAHQKEHLTSVGQNQDLMSIPSNQALFDPIETGVAKDVLVALAERFCAVPNGFHLHAKLDHLIKERLKMVKEDKPIDWGMAEYLAYATLLWEGTPVRLSGQDCCRGTFSHRHAMWIDQQREEIEYYPLNHLKDGQGRFEVFNSPLSEMAILGFEYGYSVVCPQGLTIWEAQFGDFGNGAQVIIDQYIASGEQKWGQRSKLVLFLPHGYEGQGPEHSSGRLERFLTLAGHDNMQIVNPTTPAQFFHLLRRQIHRDIEKPLIVFTPKGLLRHPAATSRLDELTQGSFQEILGDPLPKPQGVRRLVLCSGRIYYDLLTKREKDQRKDVAFIRLEQLYPLNARRLIALLSLYTGLQDCLWVQEEPQNMGAWSYIYPCLNELLPRGLPLFYVGRERSATPATGSHSRHEQEHTNILQQVFQL
ncbi:2-oxoglutarate dehydrogenase E1 component [Candidatus Protochlamydia phocaeensis]|uniref:2-oxoglutarate dehydrogenase E1 component n=1 Tax=Candidatus Protochlamydia phocaeensis TaxID=1414722 RepID=UPI000837CFAA|nr:2-oxoglutarate dehydrogenase E1 component [Candidatus Protochlamydia phocaeensis]